MRFSNENFRSISNPKTHYHTQIIFQLHAIAYSHQIYVDLIQTLPFLAKICLMFPFSVATSVEILFNAILFNDTWYITNLMTYRGRYLHTKNNKIRLMWHRDGEIKVLWCVYQLFNGKAIRGHF
jgi:hypothetical protein